MLRILFCMTCCSVPPTSRSGKRKSSSNPNLQTKRDEANKSQQSLQQQQQALTEVETNDKSKSEDANTKLITLAASEKDQLLANQVQANNENYGTSKSGDAQGKLNIEIDSTAAAASVEAAQLEPREQDDELAASSSFKSDQQATLASYASISERDAVDRYGDVRLDSSLYDTNGSVSPASSDDIGPYTESTSGDRQPEGAERVASGPNTEGVGSGEAGAAGAAAASASSPEEALAQAEALERVKRGDVEQQQQQQQQQQQLYGAADGASSVPNVPSTTRIGDYARLEYSPVEDLDSVTTMSYSRLGSERGAGGRSQAGSTLSRQNSLGRTTGATEGSLSRRSSQGGVESTSISIASQLSNEQFQQNLTNMLESVNSNYPTTFGTIGLPLGPPVNDANFVTETTKTSPETPGAALTSASQDSLSDASFNGELSPKLNQQTATLRSNQSSGGALVNDPVQQQERANMEEMAELAKPAPLASGEDERLGSDVEGNAAKDTAPSGPYASVVTSASGAGAKVGAGERVGSPQSFTTTTSGGITNPTPTPSEMSAGSGKKKKLKAKALFKKFKPGGKSKNKNNNDETA